MLRSIKKNQEGVSLYLIIVAMLIILSLTLTLSTLILIRFRSTQRLSDSIVAFYVADSGIEEELYHIGNLAGRGSNSGGPSDWSGLDDTVYSVRTNCRDGYTKCLDLCDTCTARLSCSAPRFCIESQGSFKESKRAIEVRY